MNAHALRFRGRTYPVVLPNPRDPRLHVAAVVMSLQVLGQAFLHFDISIAQILLALATCAILEIGITAWRDRALVWPASALLTGNGVAFVLRVPGTQHGDWWALRGGWIFVATAAVSLLSKYLVRVGGRPLFNPSNFGLVLCFVALGSGRVEPLDFWWVRPGPALVSALILIVGGGLFLARRVRMFAVVVSFTVAFAASVGLLAASGHCITARWHLGPVCDGYFWQVLVTSPEVLVFVFFMITDPKTVPHGRRARVVFGAGIAVVAVAFAAPQRTEFATKVALLGALLLVCAARPLIERWFPVGVLPRDRAPERRARRRVVTGAAAIVAVTMYTAMVLVAGAPARSGETSLQGAGPVPATCDGGSARVTPRRPASGAQPLPSVRVGNPINVATSISQVAATRIVRDVVDDLVIAADALEHRRPELVALAARYPWSKSLLETICATPGPAVLPTHRFTSAVVTVAKRAVGQRDPEIDVSLVSTAAFHETYVVTQSAGMWLICGPKSDPRTAVCNSSR